MVKIHRFRSNRHLFVLFGHIVYIHCHFNGFARKEVVAQRVRAHMRTHACLCPDRSDGNRPECDVRHRKSHIFLVRGYTKIVSVQSVRKPRIFKPDSRGFPFARIGRCDDIAHRNLIVTFIALVTPWVRQCIIAYSELALTLIKIFHLYLV